MNGFLRFLEGAVSYAPRFVIAFITNGIIALVSISARKLHEISRTNLRRVYGPSKSDRECRSMTDQCLKSIGQGMVDLLYYVKNPKKLMAITHVEGEEHLKAALSEGKGVIAVSAHMGNFPLLFVSLVQRGYKVNVIIRTMRDQEFSKFIFHLCSKWGIHMIETSPRKEFVRESLGALKRNEPLFILLDEFVDPANGIQVPFFNTQVTRATGPMLFLERMGSPVVPIFIAKDEKKEFRISINPRFAIHAGGTDEENTRANIAGLTKIIEGFVVRYPMQWGGWLNKRWAKQV